ncbi:MAG: zinc-dependent alcohol dehydrogenase [Acidobacteriota bacterium]
MKALFLRDDLVLSLEEIAEPQIIDNSDVIVRVTGSSICGSDIHAWKGHIPCIPNFILGHEFVGTISEVGSGVHTFQVGDRVAVPANPFCGICPNCAAGKVYNCLTVKGMFGFGKAKGDLPGAQSEYVRVPFADACLTRIPQSVSDEAALLVGDVLSTGMFAVENGNVKPGDNVAIFGAGPVGLCAVACANLFNPARLFLIDIEDYRLEQGKRLGATHVINPLKQNVIGEIKAATGGLGVDCSIDAVGLPNILKDCTVCTTPGGIISVVGIGPPKIEFHMDRFFFRNLTMKGGYVPLTQMKRLLTLIETGRLDVSSLITHRLPLTDIVEGYNIFADKLDDCIKVMIIPDQIYSEMYVFPPH